MNEEIEFNFIFRNIATRSIADDIEPFNPNNSWANNVWKTLHTLINNNNE